MWGNKKDESELSTEVRSLEVRSVPAAAAPARVEVAQKVQQIDSTKPVVKPQEGRSMSAEVSRSPVSMSSVGSGPAGAGARLGASLRVKGEISGNEDLQIDGTVEGLVTLDDRKLTVGIAAKLTADVIAREIVVYGSVKGNLRARDRIEIKKDGSVVGDLTTARIMIEDGAYFKGAIEIDRQALESGADSTKSAYSRVSSPVSAD
jgi:cytoskeletal protein CcmA (bactofilin family)